MGVNEHKAGGIDVGYVANLARLKLEPEESVRFQEQLESVVGYIDKLGELDLTGVEPMLRAQALQNVFRADEVRTGLEHEAVMNNAPSSSDGMFSVPKIIE